MANCNLPFCLQVVASENKDKGTVRRLWGAAVDTRKSFVRFDLVTSHPGEGDFREEKKTWTFHEEHRKLRYVCIPSAMNICIYRPCENAGVRGNAFEFLVCFNVLKHLPIFCCRFEFCILHTLISYYWSCEVAADENSPWTIIIGISDAWKLF